MAYIQTIPFEEATSTLRELYDENIKSVGYVPTAMMALSMRPDVIKIQRSLIEAIKSKMNLRHYELATIATTSLIRCSA